MARYIVAIDSMKGCLSSSEASEAFASGVRESAPDAEVISLPVADGGEGTAVILAKTSVAPKRMVCGVIGPLGRPVAAEWWYDKASATAFIDMAQSSGLPLVEGVSSTPVMTTGYGLGQLILAALDEGASGIIVGLGGSATVDGGLGACQALGVAVLDSEGHALEAPFVGGMLEKVADIDVSGLDPRLKETNLTLVCDVGNPLTGENGAARVFGPQKGASPEDVAALDAGLENIRRIAVRKFGIDLNKVPGSGAAGGCAGGIMSFAGGRIAAGASFVLDTLRFDSLVRDVDFIVTGEGCADAQTLMGKIPGEILRRGKAAGVPVALAAGCFRESDVLLEAGFSRLIDINDNEAVKASSAEWADPLDSSVARRRLVSAGLLFGCSEKLH